MRPHTRKRLIAIVGHIGCGKTTVADYLKKRHGFNVVSVSGVLRSLLDKYSDDRRVFQQQCMDWIKQHGALRLGEMVAVECAKYDLSAIDGMRLRESIRSLQDRFSGRVTLVGLRCSGRTAFTRQQLQHGALAPIRDYQTFLATRRHLAERENDALVETADYVLVNDGSKDSLFSRVDSILKQLHLEDS